LDSTAFVRARSLNRSIYLIKTTKRGIAMAGSYYKIIEVVGTSDTSWEEAAKGVVEEAAKNLRDMRVAEITKLDMKIQDGKVVSYRARVSLSFKYHS
jgi:flavin-binding protein dodecin